MNYSVTALDTCFVCKIPKSVFLKEMMNNIDFRQSVYHLLFLEFEYSNKKQQKLAKLSKRQRLADLILELKNDFGLLDVPENAINIRISREEIGNTLGTATETVIRLLSEFQAEGLIVLDGRRICLLDEKSLKQVAYGNNSNPVNRRKRTGKV